MVDNTIRLPNIQPGQTISLGDLLYTSNHINYSFTASNNTNSNTNNINQFGGSFITTMSSTNSLQHRAGFSIDTKMDHDLFKASDDSFTLNWESPKLSEKELQKQRRQVAKREKLIKKAKVRADRLLKKWLSKTEYESLKSNGLKIQSKINVNIHYIVKDRDYNRVERYMNNEYKDSLCVISHEYENDDTVLAKILLLQTDEEKFLQTAIEWP